MPPGPALAVRLRAAQPDDRGVIGALLAAAGLPPLDGAAASGQCWVAELAGQVIGTVSLEAYGEHGLLRSLCVDARARGRGIGQSLVKLVETHAACAGIIELVLLTETADRFFADLGFDPIDRATVPGTIRAGRMFATLCPTSARCLGKSLNFQHAEPTP